MRRSLAIAGAAVAVAAAAGTPLHAQGSSVDQHSACMSARVGAGVASPCDDASAIYFSPAGLAFQGSALGLNVSLIRSSSEFNYHANMAPPTEDNPVEREAEVIPVPAAFLSYKVTPRLAAGVGVFAPYGLGLTWPVCPVDEPGCDETNFEGRYTGYDNSIRSIYFQPTVAYAVTNALSVGVGLDYVRMTIDVHQRQDAPQLGLSGRDIADVFLSGEGDAVTGHVGAMLRFSPKASIAARYLHSVTVDLTGDADVTQIATGTIFDPAIAAQLPPDQGINTEVELPSQFVVGVSYRPVEGINLMFDYQFTEWSNFDAFDINFETSGNTNTLNLGYRDTNTFRLGAELDWSEALTLRGGFRYNTAATPRATPFLPEGERNYFSVGFGYRVTPRLTADVGFQYINQPDREGAVRPGAQSVGVYAASGQILGLTLSYRFGGNDGQ